MSVATLIILLLIVASLTAFDSWNRYVVQADCLKQNLKEKAEAANKDEYWIECHTRKLLKVLLTDIKVMWFFVNLLLDIGIVMAFAADHTF